MFFAFSSSVGSVAGQRRHAQLVSESHQEVQVREAFSGVGMCVLRKLLSDTRVRYRPAVSASVRWPALTPLKRKGKS